MKVGEGMGRGDTRCYQFINNLVFTNQNAAIKTMQLHTNYFEINVNIKKTIRFV